MACCESVELLARGDAEHTRLPLAATLRLEHRKGLGGEAIPLLMRLEHGVPLLMIVATVGMVMRPPPAASGVVLAAAAQVAAAAAAAVVGPLADIQLIKQSQAMATWPHIGAAAAAAAGAPRPLGWRETP
jgi:hypothetical protein